MVIKQSFNNKTNRWVKWKRVKAKNGGTYTKYLDVKQKNPQVPFANTPIHKK